MRIERIQTRHGGGFIEIIVPEDFVVPSETPTGDEMIAAAMRYMSKVYGNAMRQISVATTFTNVAINSYAETLDIMNDEETMEAIREGQADTDEVQPNESA